jgi:hypothetical protein
VVALGFTDSGFVGLPVMVLGVAGGPVWLILSLVVGFVQWVSVGYEVGHGGFLWGVWLAVGRGGHSCSNEIASILGNKLPLLEFLSVYYISLL